MKRIRWLFFALVATLSSSAAHGQEVEETSNRDGIRIDRRPTVAVEMFVVTTDETSLMRDGQVLVTLKKGTRLTISAIRGDQVRAEVKAEGRRQVGWAQIGHVMVVSNPRSRLHERNDIGGLAEPLETGDESRWRESLADYTEVTENGAIVLSMDSALQLARIHSPTYQRQLEALYRSSLAVGTVRADQRRSGKGGDNEDAETFLRNNLQAFSRFRQGFYTHIAIGELDVSELATVGDRDSHELKFRLAADHGGLGEGGFIGLLQQMQQIRNSEDNLGLQLRTLAQLEAHHSIGVIDLVQVEQFRLSVENERANLLHQHNDLKLSLDGYKTGTLGLPPDLQIKLDDSLIRQLQLGVPKAIALKDSMSKLQGRVGTLQDDAGVKEILQLLIDVFKIVEPVRRQFGDARADLARMDEAVPERERSMTEMEKKLLRRNREQLGDTLALLEEQFHEAVAELKTLREGLSEQNRRATARRLVVWVSDVLRLVERSTTVQTRARLEAITVEPIRLRSQDAFEIALKNRLDIMTARAELASRARGIAALRAESDSGPHANSRFRQALMDYRRDRRQFIQALDGVHIGLRQLLRSLEELHIKLEIQRRAVAIAMRNVDVARAPLSAPVPPPQPEQRVRHFRPTTATTLATTLSALRDSQDKLVIIWSNHLASRMVLLRDLGIMKLDEEGRWVDTPVPSLAGP